MAATQRLELRQSQSLVMTPQLQQAIKLLQLSNLELAAYVDQELERNPLIERDDGAPSGPVEETGAAESLGDPDQDLRQQGSELESSERSHSEFLPSDNDAPLDTDFDNVFSHDGPSEGASPSMPSTDATGSTETTTHSFSQNWSNGAAKSGPIDQDFDQDFRETKSLRQHLLDQLMVEKRDPSDLFIGTHIIDLLDESGYLRGDLDNLAELLGCSMAQIESTLELLQGFDPTGVFARDLGECLSLQLAEQDRLDPAMACLVQNLDLLADRDLAALRKKCGVDHEDFAEMLAELKSLDPKPGSAFAADHVEILVPDILMSARPDGSWLIELNSETLPRVLVNESYYAVANAKTRDKADRAYLADQLQAANWLVKSLHQRATTILRVATEIVRQQDAFFRKGVHFLKPLTLKDIAGEIEMHESTVSRVTSNKFIVTPRGTFELRYFFTAAIAGADGTSHSAESVRQRIKQLIDKEPPKKVLSDDTIVEILRQDGVDIARRTVAKYREAMRIPSSVQRRKEKRAFS
ncbi:MAG: RNA polymerase factor sigma-54 [Pseudomonadota bacterium]